MFDQDWLTHTDPRIRNIMVTGFTGFAWGKSECVRFAGPETLLYCSGRMVPVDSNQVCMYSPRWNDSEPLGPHLLDVVEHKVCFTWEKGTGPTVLLIDFVEIGQ